ncbi:MAG: tetratricopeptide repeat protein [Planctomycetota bacterium]|jgi:tetratricopeptide (TPR) repeat protein
METYSRERGRRTIRGLAWIVFMANFALIFAGCDQKNAPSPVPGESGETKVAGQTEGAKGAPGEAKERAQEGSLQAELGDVYLKHGRFQDAIDCFNLAIKVTKPVFENAIYHLGLAQAYKGLGNMDEAVKNLEHAAEIFKRILPTVKEEQKAFYYKKICLIYTELGRRKEAVQWAEKIAGKGENLASILELARLYSLLKEGALAIDTYTMALKKAGDTADAEVVKLEFADYLAQNKNLAEARKMAEDLATNGKNAKLRLGAKRLLLRIYDALGILDEVEMGAPKEGGEEEKEKEEDKGEGGEGEKK